MSASLVRASCTPGELAAGHPAPPDSPKPHIEPGSVRAARVAPKERHVLTDPLCHGSELSPFAAITCQDERRQAAPQRRLRTL